MAKLDLEWLQVFDEVFKTASVSKAADRLGMPQAAASTGLIRLRAYFGDMLFSRTARGMLPTPFAEAIQPSLHGVLVQLETARASRSGFVPAQARRTFRVSMTDISEIVLLPILLNHLRQAAPFVQVEVEKISTDSVRRLQDGDVDLAVGFMPQLDAGFYQQVLFAQNFICLAAASHPRIHARLTQGGVCPRRPCGGQRIGHRACDCREGARTRQRQAPVGAARAELPGVARIVAETELIATVPLRYGELMATREQIRLVACRMPCPSTTQAALARTLPWRPWQRMAQAHRRRAAG
ncbi:MAG: LysR family transcriptional regulator [Polaromonas sp.]|nr:LysR family transcriptional regulator [Polaromonas sp.]